MYVHSGNLEGVGTKNTGKLIIFVKWRRTEKWPSFNTIITIKRVTSSPFAISLKLKPVSFIQNWGLFQKHLNLFIEYT